MRTRLLIAAGVVALAVPLIARQQAATPRVVTAADYARAEKFLAGATTPLVYNLTVQPTWLADGKFWYRSTTAAGASAGGRGGGAGRGGAPPPPPYQMQGAGGRGEGKGAHRYDPGS